MQEDEFGGEADERYKLDLNTVTSGAIISRGRELPELLMGPEQHQGIGSANECSEKENILAVSRVMDRRLLLSLSWVLHARRLRQQSSLLRVETQVLGTLQLHQ